MNDISEAKELITRIATMGHEITSLQLRVASAETRLTWLSNALEPLCPCDTNPATTDGPQRECPLHGDGTTFVDDMKWLWRIADAASEFVFSHKDTLEPYNKLVKALQDRESE